MWVSPFHWLEGGGQQRCASDRACVSVEQMAKVNKEAALVRGSVSKGEAEHRRSPTDTGANKCLLLPAGDQPAPQGISQIKRSPEPRRGRGSLGGARTMTRAASPGMKHAAGCSATQPDMENFADLRFDNEPPILLTSNHFVLFYWAGKDHGGLMNSGFKGMSLVLFQILPSSQPLLLFRR